MHDAPAFVPTWIVRDTKPMPRAPLSVCQSRLCQSASLPHGLSAKLTHATSDPLCPRDTDPSAPAIQTQLTYPAESWGAPRPPPAAPGPKQSWIISYAAAGPGDEPGGMRADRASENLPKRL